MKTLPSRQGKSPVVGAGLSGLSITTTSSDDHDHDDAAEEEDFQDAEEGEGGRSTRFGTVESYRTAREQGDEDWSSTARSRSSTNGRRRHARDLWSQASGQGTDEEVKAFAPSF